VGSDVDNATGNNFDSAAGMRRASAAISTSPAPLGDKLAAMSTGADLIFHIAPFF
jgi:hypothetical protein